MSKIKVKEVEIKGIKIIEPKIFIDNRGFFLESYNKNDFKEFRIMIVRMIQNLGNRIEKIQETFNKDVEELKRNQAKTQ